MPARDRSGVTPKPRSSLDVRFGAISGERSPTEKEIEDLVGGSLPSGEELSALIEKLNGMAFRPDREAAVACNARGYLLIPAAYYRAQLKDSGSPTRKEVIQEMLDVTHAAMVLRQAIKKLSPYALHEAVYFREWSKLESSNGEEIVKLYALAQRGEDLIGENGDPGLCKLQEQLYSLALCFDVGSFSIGVQGGYSPGEKTFREGMYKRSEVVGCVQGLLRSILSALREIGHNDKRALPIARVIHEWAKGEFPPLNWGKREYSAARKALGTHPPNS